MKQLVLDIAPAPRPTLENFVAGRNDGLLAQIRALPNSPVGKRSLYIWGLSGSGRSHIIEASADHFSRSGLRVGRADGTAWDVLALCDLVVLDDVEKLNATGQIALFNLFNQLRDAGRSLIVSGACAPGQLQVRDDLKTRLGWGLVYQIEALDDAEKAEALRRHADERGFHMSTEVVDYLLRHVRRDLNSLMAMLDAIDRWSLAEKKPVTVPMLRQLLQQPLDLQ